MATLVQRLSLLAGCEPRYRATVISEAIAHARPDEIPALARAGLATGDAVALAAVICHLHRFEDDVEPLLRRVRAKPLREALDLVLADAEPQQVRNVIDIVVMRPDPGLVARLPRMLAERGEGVSEAAGQALVTIVLSVHGPTGRRRAPADLADGLDRALAAAGRTYRAHRSPAVLLAIALMTERPRSSLAALLDDPEEAVSRAVRGAIDRHDEPLVNRNLVRWLANPYLGRSAARAFAGHSGPRAWADLLHDGHLLRTPRRRQPLQRLDRAARCAPLVDAAVSLPPETQTHLAILLERLDLPARVRRNRLADLIALPSPVARQRAVMALLGETAAEETTVAFALDRDIRVARLAVHGLLIAGVEPDPGILDRLIHSGHRSLAVRAASRRARCDAAGFFRNWTILSGVHRRAAALAVRQVDRAGLVAGFRALLERGEEGAQVEVIDLVRRLRLVTDLEEELIEIAGHGAPRAASGAIAALPAGRSARRVVILAEALRHAHPRVVANALEGLARAGAPSDLEKIAPFAHAEANRPRGNAVRALLDADRARGVPALRDMLGDANPLHRVSAIWAARHGAASEALDELARLARDDRVPEVRVRAEAARRWLAATTSPPRPGRPPHEEGVAEIVRRAMRREALTP